MNYLKKSNFLTISILTLLAFSLIISTAVACRPRRKTIIRPIDDWVEYNEFGIGVPFETAYVGGDRKGNHYWMWPDWSKTRPRTGRNAPGSHRPALPA